MEIGGNAYLPNLNGYNVAVSLGNSGITFGSQRVISLRIKQVRGYGAAGNLLFLDPTSRVLHER